MLSYYFSKKETILIIMLILFFLLLFSNWLTPIQTLHGVESDREFLKGYSLMLYDGKSNNTYIIKNLYINVEKDSNIINLKLKVLSDEEIKDVIFSVLSPNEIFDLKVRETIPSNVTLEVDTSSSVIFSSTSQPSLFLIEETGLKVDYLDGENESYIYTKGTTVYIQIKEKNLKEIFIDLELKTTSSFFWRDYLKENLPFHIPFFSYPIEPFFNYYISFGLFFPKADIISLENLVLEYPGDIKPKIYNVPSIGDKRIETFGIVGFIPRNIINSGKIINAELTKWRNIESIISNKNWPLSHYKGKINLADIAFYGPSIPRFEGPGILSIYEDFIPLFSLEKFILCLIFVIIFSIALPKETNKRGIEIASIMITLFIFIFGLWVEEFNRGIHLNILDFGYAILLSYLLLKMIIIMNQNVSIKLKRILIPLFVIFITYYILFSIFELSYNLNYEFWGNVIFNSLMIYLPYATSLFFSIYLGLITSILKFFLLDFVALQTTSIWKYLFLFRYFGFVLVPFIYNKIKNSKYSIKIKNKLKYEFLHRALFTIILLWICWFIFHLIFTYIVKLEPENMMDYIKITIEILIVIISTELNILLFKKLKIL